jgi:hypothetical protein
MVPDRVLKLGRASLAQTGGGIEGVTGRQRPGRGNGGGASTACVDSACGAWQTAPQSKPGARPISAATGIAENHAAEITVETPK